MNELEDVRQQLFSGKIEKLDAAMHIRQLCERIGELADILPDTVIKQISIEQGNAFFTIQAEGIEARFYYVPKYWCIPVSFLGLNCTINECHIFRMMRRLLSPGDVLFDVGANIGWYSVMMQYAVPNITIFSFEPNPTIYPVLKKNLAFNGFSEDLTFEVGLSNKTQMSLFYLDTSIPEASSLRNLQFTEHVKSQECQTQRLDDFVDQHRIEKINYIKCDVEGAELLVLEGGLNTLRSYQPILQLEMLRKWSALYQYHPNDIIALLRQIGYVGFYVKENRLCHFDRMNEETQETNFIFLHQKKHEVLLQDATLISD